MLKDLRRRWGIIPTWIKVVPIVALVAALSGIHQSDTAHTTVFASTIHRLFFIPIFLSSLLFGLRGGLICAAVISLNFIPEYFGEHKAPMATRVDTAMEVMLYLLTAFITGLFVDRERREARRLKKAEDLALLGQAAAAVAHELKTPLVAIGGFAQQINRDLEEGHPHQEKLRIIVDQVAHMEQLLREMLDYSRPIELRLQPQSFNELVKEVVSLCAASAKEAEVNIVQEVDPGMDSPPIDGGRMKQVVLNLVQNAVQASPRGGKVWVITRQTPKYVEVEVADQGSGIPQEHWEKLFFPFFTTKRGGTGLGLAISHKIVEAHQGALELVKSNENGTTFRVQLPVKKLEAALAPAQLGS
jgi:two-component system sensor histidine kinase HydH